MILVTLAAALLFWSRDFLVLRIGPLVVSRVVCGCTAPWCS